MAAALVNIRITGVFLFCALIMRLNVGNLRSFVLCKAENRKLRLTQKPIPSPFINIGINYMNQAVRLWNEIFQIVKENCSTDYGEVSPQDDLMERLLRARKG